MLDFAEYFPLLYAGALSVNNLDGQDATAEALWMAAMQFRQTEALERRIIIMATAGEPGTCDFRDPATPEERQEARTQTEEAVRDLYDFLGIEVWVFSVGEAEAQEHLQRMANAGIGNPFDDPEPARVYLASEREILIEALRDAMEGCPPRCGNGVVQIGEQCDGGDANGDGQADETEDCDSDCRNKD